MYVNTGTYIPQYMWASQKTFPRSPFCPSILGCRGWIQVDGLGQCLLLLRHLTGPRGRLLILCEPLHICAHNPSRSSSAQHEVINTYAEVQTGYEPSYVFPLYPTNKTHHGWKGTRNFPRPGGSLRSMEVFCFPFLVRPHQDDFLLCIFQDKPRGSA